VLAVWLEELPVEDNCVQPRSYGKFLLFVSTCFDTLCNNNDRICVLNHLRNVIESQIQIDNILNNGRID